MAREIRSWALHERVPAFLQSERIVELKILTIMGMEWHNNVFHGFTIPFSCARHIYGFSTQTYAARTLCMHAAGTHACHPSCGFLKTKTDVYTPGFQTQTAFHLVLLIFIRTEGLSKQNVLVIEERQLTVCWRSCNNQRSNNPQSRR